MAGLFIIAHAPLASALRAAAGHFRKALQLAEIKSEQAFLAKRLAECEQDGR